MSQYGSQYYSSIGASQFQSVTDQQQLNSIIQKMQGDTYDKSIKFAKPKYTTNVEKTYEELAPITKKTIQLPTKQSKKVRTTEPVFQKPIVLNENAGVSTILNNNDLAEDVPIPTNSVINNLIKDSVIQSQTSFNPEILESKNYNNSYKNNNYNNIINNDYNNSINPNYNNSINNDYNNSINPNYNNSINNNYNNNKYQTKYEERIRQSEQQKYKSSMAKNSFNPKGSEIPQPEVFEGEGLHFSSQQNNSSVKPSASSMQSKVKNSYAPNNNESVHQTNLQSQKHQSNNSINPSKVHHSNMPQQSIQSNKSSHHSNHPSQIQNQQSNIYNQSSKQSNIPPNQSNVHSSSKHSMKSQNPPMNQSNMYQKSMQQSNVPHQSTHPSQVQMQQSNIPHHSNHPSQIPKQQSNIYNQSSKQSTHPSKVQSNVMNNNYNNSMKNSECLPQLISQQQSNMNNQSTKKSNIPQKSSHNSQLNQAPNNNNIDINATNITNLNQLGMKSAIYETQILGSNIDNNIPNNSIQKSNQNNIINNKVNSIHVSKSKNSEINNNKISVEPKPGEYNIMNNRTTMENYNQISYPSGSNMANNLGKTALPPNPFDGKMKSMKGSGLPNMEQKVKYSSKKGF